MGGEFKNQQGAGWTKYYNDNSGKKIGYKKVWVYVKKMPKKWTPIMKIISSGSIFGYNSKYWTNVHPYNPNSKLGELKDAKYTAFMTKAFKSIRICVGWFVSPICCHFLTSPSLIINLA